MNGGSRAEIFAGADPLSAELQSALDRATPLLVRKLGIDATRLTAQSFRGGQSNKTILVSAHDRRLVLKFEGQRKSQRALAHEFATLSAFRARGVRTPEPLLLCDDPAVAGRPFSVVENVAGRVFWDVELPGIAPAERAAIYAAMNETIGFLHQIPLEPSDALAPPRSLTQTIGQAWELCCGDLPELGDLRRLRDALVAQAPQDCPVGYVHGDFGLWNIIFHPTRPEVAAVVDWESAGVGNPLADLSYHLMPWHVPPDPLRPSVSSLVGLDLDALGIPSADSYIASYCKVSGRAFEYPEFYLALAFFRWAAIIRWLLNRAHHKQNENPRMLHGPERVSLLAADGLRILARNGGRHLAAVPINSIVKAIS